MCCFWTWVDTWYVICIFWKMKQWGTWCSDNRAQYFGATSAAGAAMAALGRFIHRMNYQELQIEGGGETKSSVLPVALAPGMSTNPFKRGSSVL